MRKTSGIDDVFSSDEEEPEVETTITVKHKFASGKESEDTFDMTGNVHISEYRGVGHHDGVLVSSNEHVLVIHGFFRPRADGG